MKSFTLDWKGWWILRTPISDVPELSTKCCIYAIMGAKLMKVGNGIGSSGREPVMFGVHKGDESIKDHLLKLQKMSLGVFALNRCKEIKKHPTIYVAALPDDADLGDLAAILSLIYGAVPFAPKHHAMPAPYAGENFHIKNAGRNPGLPEEVFHRDKVSDSDKTRDGDATQDGEADAAMSAAIAAEAQATRRLTQEEMEVRGIATEKVAKPPGQIPTEKLEKPPRLVETTKVDKNKLEQGLATERVPKPPGVNKAADNGDTEFVPKPNGEDSTESAESTEPTILDEAGR